MTGVLVRLGNVLYWLCTGVAAMFGIGAIVSGGFNLLHLWQHEKGVEEIVASNEKVLNKPHEIEGPGAEQTVEPSRIEDIAIQAIPSPSYEGLAIAGMLVVSALVVWLMGRAARYILAGK